MKSILNFFKVDIDICEPNNISCTSPLPFPGKNGFKCHTMSESHQRQLLLLAEDVDKYMDTFSK